MSQETIHGIDACITLYIMVSNGFVTVVWVFCTLNFCLIIHGGLCYKIARLYECKTFLKWMITERENLLKNVTCSSCYFIWLYPGIQTNRAETVKLILCWDLIRSQQFYLLGCLPVWIILWATLKSPCPRFTLFTQFVFTYEIPDSMNPLNTA